MTIHKHSKSEKIRSNKQTEKIKWHNYNHKPNKYNNKQQQTPTNNNKHQQTTQTKTHQNKETHFALTESRRVGECVIAAPPAGHGNFHSSRAVGLEGL